MDRQSLRISRERLTHSVIGVRAEFANSDPYTGALVARGRELLGGALKRHSNDFILRVLEDTY
jgi:hypothetical protein